LDSAPRTDIAAVIASDAEQFSSKPLTGRTSSGAQASAKVSPLRKPGLSSSAMLQATQTGLPTDVTPVIAALASSLVDIVSPIRKSTWGARRQGAGDQDRGISAVPDLARHLASKPV